MANVIKQPCDDGVLQCSEATLPCSRSVGTWVLIATILGSSMAFVDGTVVNVALPVFQSELNATVSDVQWIVESYALFLAALLLVGGALGDRFGRKRIFGVGVSLFALASVTCGMSQTTTQLIIFRGAQGVGGALLVPGSLAIISATFDRAQRGRAIGTWSAFTAITAALGPVLGGWLIENLSWRWIFFVNIPLAVAVIAIVLWRVPESRGEATEGRLDWVGAVLATLGLGLVVYGLIESANLGLGHPVVLLTIALGFVGLVAFILVEAKGRTPMLPLSLFASRDFSGANIVTLFLYSALSAGLFFLPFNLIQVQGYSTTAAGAAFLPLILIIFLLSRWAGGLVTRFGATIPLVVGPTVAAVGYVLFALPDIGGSYWQTFFPAVAVLGIGMAISVAPLTTVVMNAVGTTRSGLASGVNNAISRTAGLVSIAVMGVFVLTVFNNNLDARLELLDLSAEARTELSTQRVKLAAAEVPAGLDDEMTGAVARAIASSFVVSFRVLMMIAAGLALASAVAAGLILGRKGSGQSSVGA
ncbi:MAG: DHA2 family efflux MFS transporter permease subunit [Candidatus Krumholzibacteria bacterium]|nr:DHA2 family efflux MFS transporter permease subunit [Candidatus Krumholzibacteria bacterium]